LLAKDFGGDNKMTSLPVASNWTDVVVRGVHVVNGKCTLGLYSDANAGNWCQIDNVQFVKDDIPYTFLKGGDISELDYLESKSAVFYENGMAKDSLKILKDYGFNIVRLRLYNDPGNLNYSPSKLLPAGFQNPTGTLKLANRAKAMGFEIGLTFYYSDYWTDGIPHDWDSLSVNELDSAVYAFTYNLMSQMKSQGTTPEYVSLGDEMQGGIL
jgi:arabinogalactan endo-1,4-beta-galactosidase